MQNIEENKDLSPEEDIRRAADVMRRGGVILYPTDTVWGIGCDARNSEAVKHIYEIKKRVDNKALITLVGDLGMLERTVCGIPDVAYDLIEFSERPLTIVYDEGTGVAPELKGIDGTIGVRLTKEDFSQRLCRRVGAPIVSTSANISGEPTPRTFAEISPEILNAVDYVCATRRNDRTPGQPSSVMRLSEDGTFKVLRP